MDLPVWQDTSVERMHLVDATCLGRAMAQVRSSRTPDSTRRQADRSAVGNLLVEVMPLHTNTKLIVAGPTLVVPPRRAKP